MHNPFQPTRFEFENKPIIWLSTWARDILKTKKTDFIVGSRGSGKTTVLCSLQTKNILEDRGLYDQFRMRHLHWFGAYMQFNQNFQSVSDKIIEVASKHLGRSVEEIERYKFFCAFFELSLIECVLNDLRKLEEAGHIHFSAKKEAEAGKELQGVFGRLKVNLMKEVLDYSDATRLIRSIRASFLALYDEERIEEALQIVDTFVPTMLIRIIEGYVMPSIRSRFFNSKKNIDLYILLDDCENLSAFQQKCLNTYFRSSEGIAKWTIAYVRGRYDTISTMFEETSLSHADRTFRNVDSLSDEDFKNFCEQVTNLRLKNFITSFGGKNINEEAKFSVSSCGSYSYNNLIDQSLEGYQSKPVLSFRSRVGVTKSKLQSVIEKKRFSSFSIESDQNPYIEHTIIELLDIDVFNYSSSTKQERLRKEIHRKEGAAFVAASVMSERPAIYAGDRFILWASDKNIRDFLDIMAEFFDRRARNRGEADGGQYSEVSMARRFMDPRNTFSPSFQNECLRIISSRALETIQQMETTSSRYAYLLLTGLIELQKLLHRTISNGDAVRTPERGIFVVDYMAFDRLVVSHKLPGLSGIIRRMERDGFVKMVDLEDLDEGVETAFRLHKRLAPAIGCSPRGAYERVRLDVMPLSVLMSQSEVIDPKLWARNAYNTIWRRDIRQANLFD